MKKLLLATSFLLLSATTFANETIGVEALSSSGLLNVGTKIGKCEVITSKLLRAYGTGPVSGMQIEVQSGNKIVMAILDAKITVSEDNNNKSEVIESFLESTTGGDNPLSAIFEKRTSQRVRIEDREISRGKGAIIDLLIETKKESTFGNLKVVQDESIRCN